MTFIADKSLDAPIIKRLRKDGYSIISISELAPGISDDEVLEIANRESRILITADKDFGEPVFRLKRITSGVVLVRLMGLSLEEKVNTVSQFIPLHYEELKAAFTVITQSTFRIRKLSKDYLENL